MRVVGVRMLTRSRSRGSGDPRTPRGGEEEAAPLRTSEAAAGSATARRREEKRGKRSVGVGAGGSRVAPSQGSRPRPPRSAGPARPLFGAPSHPALGFERASLPPVFPGGGLPSARLSAGARLVLQAIYRERGRLRMQDGARPGFCLPRSRRRAAMCQTRASAGRGVRRGPGHLCRVGPRVRAGGDALRGPEAAGPGAGDSRGRCWPGKQDLGCCQGWLEFIANTRRSPPEASDGDVTCLWVSRNSCAAWAGGIRVQAVAGGRMTNLGVEGGIVLGASKPSSVARGGGC